MGSERPGTRVRCGDGVDMVDRRQEQARLLDGSADPDGRARRDLVVVLATVALLLGLAVLTGVGVELLHRADGLPERVAGAAAALMVLLAVGSTVYAVRRYREVERTRCVLSELADRDPLTALPNRRFLGEPMDAILTQARRRNGRVAVLFVDLVGCRTVNEVHGHEVGDRTLIDTADRLRAVVGPEDVVVRYGGDQFVLICQDVANAFAAQRLAGRVIRAVETDVDVAGMRVALSATVGVALSEERPTRPDELLADAESALMQAAAENPGGFALFDRSMRERITPATAERRLRHALEHGELRLHYQPIVSLWTKRLVGVEALLRWRDPDRGLVSPSEFLPALETTGLIVPVGEWVVEEVCHQARRWQDENPDRPPLNVKVNVSARQLAQSTFLPHLRHALDVTGADPAHICLEVTEAALALDLDTAWSTLREAKQLGLSLALDDFGTGYSSLTYLRHMRLDLLSIDRSFIRGIGQSREDTTIVEHVIGMAKALGIVTVAEGVEHEEQVTHLRAMNCDLAQGWYFSQPQPSEFITRLLAQDACQEEWRPREQDSEAVATGDEEDDTVVVNLDRFESTRPPS